MAVLGADAWIELGRAEGHPFEPFRMNGYAKGTHIEIAVETALPTTGRVLWVAEIHTTTSGGGASHHNASDAVASAIRDLYRQPTPHHTPPETP